MRPVVKHKPVESRLISWRWLADELTKYQEERRRIQDRREAKMHVGHLRPRGEHSPTEWEDAVRVHAHDRGLSCILLPLAKV